MDISKLTLREKASQTAIVYLNKENFVEDKIGGLYVGGAVAEHEDLNGADAIKKYISKYQENTDIPVLVCSDFEHGCGGYLYDMNMTTFPHLMALGATNDEQLAYDFGKATAIEGNTIGVNWAFAPVCDLSFKGDMCDAMERVISDNPAHALKLLNPLIKGMQDYGMSACSKHFPGGDRDVRDPHITPGRIDFTKEYWYETSGKVFKNLIDNDVHTIMIGHSSFPAYQTKDENGNYEPATLSYELVTKLLKEELGFDGIAVTDALDMGGFLSGYNSREEGEIASFNAGCDMLLWPSETYIDNLVAAVENGIVSMERLDDAVTRILRVKEKLGLFEKHKNKIYYTNMTDEEAAFVKGVAIRTADKSMTLINDEMKLFPISPVKTKKVAVVPITHYEPAHMLGEFMVDELNKRGFEAHYHRELMQESEIEEYDLIIYAIFNAYGQPLGFGGFMNDEYHRVRRANSFAREKTAIVSFNNPHFGYKYFSRAHNYVNAYSIAYPSVESYIKAITGEIEFTSFSPVKLNY